LIKKKKRIRKPGTGRPPGVRIAIILLIGALAAGVLRLWACLNVADPHLNYLEVTKNSEPLMLLDGETIRLHPGDRLKITKISTNICFNRGVRIVSKELDADSLLYDAVLLADLLPDKNIYGKYTFRLDVKNLNREMGYVELMVEPLVEDWLDKTNRIIDSDKKIAVLNEAQAAFPEERKIKEKLVAEYISAKKWEEAARVLEGIVKDKPDEENLKTLLDVYENMSSNGEAISILHRLIELKPDDTELKLELADTLDKAGRTTDAIRAYEELLGIMKQEDLLPVYNNLGYLYAQTGENEKAISFYLKAMELNKDDVNLYHNLSMLYGKMGRKDKANQYRSRAIQLKPDSPDEKMKMAENLPDGGKLKEAEKPAGEYLKNNPESLEAGVKANPMDVSLKKILITSYLKTGKEDQAITQMKAVLDLNPDDKDMLRQVAKLLEKHNKVAEALTCYKKILDLDPDNEDAEEAYLRLRLKAIPK
jgi:tetratricopeptide (TPR) repeat protein